MLKKYGLMSVVLGMLSGCNTMEGLGKDIEGTGEALEKAASDCKPECNH